MMSSSDNPDTFQSDSDWRPLVPSDLQKFDREVTHESDLEDPDVQRAFKALYERSGEDGSKMFSLLYGPKRELDKAAQEQLAREQAALEPKPDELPVDQGPDLEAIKKEAYDEAYAQGQQDGYQAGLAQASEKMEHLLAIVSDVEGMWEKLVAQYENEIVGLVTKVAEKVVYGQVAVDNEIITRAILAAFKKIADPVNAVITVNPEDYEYIEAVKEDFFEEIKGLKQVTLVSDPLIDIGGCRIETPSGEVETDIEERLEAVKQCIIENSR